MFFRYKRLNLLINCLVHFLGDYLNNTSSTWPTCTIVLSVQKLSPCYMITTLSADEQRERGEGKSRILSLHSRDAIPVIALVIL